MNIITNMKSKIKKIQKAKLEKMEAETKRLERTNKITSKYERAKVTQSAIRAKSIKRKLSPLMIVKLQAKTSQKRQKTWREQMGFD